MLYEPNDRLQVRLIGDYGHRNESCCGAVYLSTPKPPIRRRAFPATSRWRRPTASSACCRASAASFRPTRSRGRSSITPGRTYKGVTHDGGVSGQVDWKLGDNVTLTSITAYRDYKSSGRQTSITAMSTSSTAPRTAMPSARSRRSARRRGFQGSALGDHLDWLIGGYYSHEDLTVRDNIKFGTQYGEFAACRLVATISPLIPRDPNSPGCSNAVTRGALAGALGAAAPIIQAGLDRLSTVNNVGDNPSSYYQKSENWALFTHNIFNITDKVALTVGLRYTHESKDFHATFNQNNAVCPTQQAFFSNFLSGGATPLPASLQPLIAGIVNLTCQGNATTALNALNLRDQRKEGEWRAPASSAGSRCAI